MDKGNRPEKGQRQKKRTSGRRLTGADPSRRERRRVAEELRSRKPSSGYLKPLNERGGPEKLEKR